MSEQKELTPQTQQTINKLSLRIQDVLEEINNVIKAFQTELKAKDEKIKDLQIPIKEKKTVVT